MVVHMLVHLSQPALVMLNVSDAQESPLLTLLALIDPSLLRMNMSGQDHSMATFVPSLGSSRFQIPALSKTDMLSQSTSLPHGNVQKLSGYGLARDAGGAMKFMWGCVLPKALPLLRAMVSPNIHTAEESGQNLAWLAGDAKLTVKSGLYYEGRKEIKSSEYSYDRTEQGDLWDWTVKNIAEGPEEAELFSLKA